MIVATEDRRRKFAELIDEGVPVQTAGDRVGISPAVAHRWAAMYRSGGLERLAPVGTTRVRYPFLVKYMAVRACLEGAGESAVLEAFVLRSAGTLLRWRQAFEKHGPAGLGGTDAEAAAAALLPLPLIRDRKVRRAHSEETRRIFVEAVQSGRGYESASRIAGIPFSTGWAWYQKHRAGHSLMWAGVESPRSYSPEVKLAVAKAVVDDGDTRADVLQRFDIRAHATLTSWARQYRLSGANAFTVRPAPHAPAKANRPVRRLIGENAVLSEVIAQLDATLPTGLKVQIVSSLAGRYPIRPLLRALRLPASTYYYRRSRPPKRDRYETVRPVLRREFETAYNAYGYRRLRMQLRRQHGLAISGKTMRRLMREEGCRCLVRRKKRRPPTPIVNPVNVFAPNLLKRNFTADEPGQKGVTDVTQFDAAGETFFLSPLIDLFNGEVLSYRVDTNQQMPMVLGMLRDALPKARGAVTTLHSDRGWQYQHAGFRRELRLHGITQSMSRSGNCYDNACAENFFSHFKQEFLRGRRWSSTQAFLESLDGYIRWFNHHRFHDRAGTFSPVAHREFISVRIISGSVGTP